MAATYYAVLQRQFDFPLIVYCGGFQGFAHLYSLLLPTNSMLVLADVPRAMSAVTDILTEIPRQIQRTWNFLRRERIRYNDYVYIGGEEAPDFEAILETPLNVCPTMSKPLTPKTIGFKNDQSGRKILLWSKGDRNLRPEIYMGDINFSALFSCDFPKDCDTYLRWLSVCHKQSVDPLFRDKFVKL